jgi:predicted phage baseplate assembly protein
MPLNTPKLDDRTFQDIVEEAKKRIPLYMADWTDHNVSDPGITFVELFAWMTEMILYRMNQVPDLHYIKFMELLGTTLQAPVPARVPVSFWLASPLETSLHMPAGLEITSTEVEGKPTIIFSTDSALEIQPPQLKAIFSAKAAAEGASKTLVSHHLPALTARNNKDLDQGVEIFTAIPQVDDALYFGFENDISDHILDFNMVFDPGWGAGIDPTRPPYVWEVWHNGGWQVCDVENDMTAGMNREGQIEMHLLKLHQRTLNEETLYWVRVRIIEIFPADAENRMRPYRTSPKLKQVMVSTIGGTASAIHAQYIWHERLGKSDGTAGQKFQLQLTPVMARQAEECLVIQSLDGEKEMWQEVSDFSASGPKDKHFTLDSVSGEIQFGPAIRQVNGIIRRYGAIPLHGDSLTFRQYRAGGNQEGNVQPGVLNTLRTPNPFIMQVSNRQDAMGGLETETLESAMVRVPRILRTRNRAVTAEDFEFLAREAHPDSVGRAKCLAALAPDGRPSGQVNVLIIPRIWFSRNDVLTADWLTLAAADMMQIKDYLAERCLLTTRVEVSTPQYRWVSVAVELEIEPDQVFQDIEQMVLQRLYYFLHPLTGGTAGAGWPFGRDLVVADVYQCLNQLPGVTYLRKVQLFLSDDSGIAQKEPVEFVTMPEDSVLVSGLHQVTLLEMER